MVSFPFTANSREADGFQAAPVAVLVADDRGQIVYTNPKLDELFGYQPAELVGAQVEVLIPERFRQSHQQHRGRYMHKPGVRSMGVGLDLVGQRQDGSEFPIEAGLSYFQREGKTYVLTTIVDLTRRKLMEQALRQSEERYRKLIENLPYGLLINRQNRVVYANPACLRLFAATQPAQLLGRSPFDLFHPDCHPQIRERIERLLATGEPVPTVEEQIIRCDGGVVAVEVAATPFQDDEGTAIQVILVDITERKRAEEALRASEEHFRLLVEGVHDHAIFMLDRDGKVISWNTGAEQIIGYRTDEIIGRPYSCFFAAEALAEGRPAERLMVAAAAGGIQDEGVRVRKDGSHFWASSTLTALYDQEGQLRGFAKLLRDVTERRHGAQQLERRVEERTRELDRRRQVAAGLQQILAMLNSSHPLAEILDHILAQATRFLQAAASTIFHADEQRGQLVPQVSHGVKNSSLRNSALPLTRHVRAFLSREGEPVVLLDIAELSAQDDPVLQSYLEELVVAGYRSLLCVPLLIGDDVYGMLTAYYCGRHSFGDEEIELASSFGSQAALAIENKQLRNQVEHAAVAAERSRLARDLHDAVTQTLFATTLLAEALPKIWEKEPDEGRRRLQELRDLSRGALAEMRTLLLELRPTRLSEISIDELLKQLVDAMRGRTRIPVQLQLEGTAQIPVDVKVALFRIAQEALNNIAKHARAHQVEVSVHGTPAEIELVVRDDGRGFRFEHIRPQNLGLSIMRERAEGIGAELCIQSAPNEGTLVSVQWTSSQRARQ
jgi:PAS domain S-box-containing protein